MAQQIALETLLLVKGSSPTLGFDFSKFGPVKAGNALSTPLVSIITAGSNVTVGTPVVIDEDFEDYGARKKILAGKGVAARFDATGGSVVLGTYNVRASAVCDGDLLYLIGKVIVIDETGST